MAGGNSKSKASITFFMELPESMHGSIMIRGNQSSTGWLICNAEGNDGLLRDARRDPADNAATGVEYERIATIGSQQLQARVVTKLLWFEPLISSREHGAVRHGVKKG